MSLKCNLIDTSFSHHTSVGLPDTTVAGNFSEKIIWERDLSKQTDFCFFSNQKILERGKYNFSKKNCFGLLFESKSIIPDVFRISENVIPDFEMFFTHDSILLSKFDNCFWIPGGGSWVGGQYAGGVRKIHNKTKLCSMVTSTKRMCEMHNKRVDIANFLKMKNLADVFGLNNETQILSAAATTDYMFNVCIENSIDDLYFTEKILNCFVTGTVPIYFGARNISKIFDARGIIQFSEKEELPKIISSLSSELYLSMKNYIEKNFIESLKFLTIEDYIYENYLKQKYNL